MNSYVKSIFWGAKDNVKFAEGIQQAINTLLFDRVAPGAVIVFDDYGWLGCRPQRLAEDAWLAKRGYRVLELPTGQGLVVT